jgi:23S rRNA pseudouridine2605 synthase
MLQRLQKIIAQAGIASRRHAEELIRSGQVRVNGEIVTELGSKADPEHDRVEVAGRVAEISDELVYIVLHKPPQVVSTMADPEGRKTLRHFLRGTPERVFPVGRLDYAASGLVLLTSDGQLAARVLRASARLPQTYWIKVKGRIEENEMRDAARAASAQLTPLKGPWARRSAENPWYEVEMAGPSRDALGRALKRMDHPIEKMKRVQLATLELGQVPEGHYRRLEPSEVEKFSRAIDRALAAPSEPSPLAQEDRSLPAPARAIPPVDAPKPDRSQFAASRVPLYAAPAHQAPASQKKPWSGTNVGGPPASPIFPRRDAPIGRPSAAPHGEWRKPKDNAWRGNKSGGPPRSSDRPQSGAHTNRPPSRPKDDWRERKDNAWRGNKTGGPPRSSDRPHHGPPTNRPPSGSRPAGDWRERKDNAWRGNKSGAPPRSFNRPPSGAPTNRPQHGPPSNRPPSGSRPTGDWGARKSNAWRGNKTGAPQRSTKQPRPGAPTHRPAAGPKGEWRERKGAPWRENKSGGDPRSPNRPPNRPPNRSQSGAPSNRPSRPQNSGGANKRRPNRPRRDDPRHTPRNSR